MPIYLQPLKKYAQLSGRASRKEYWSFYLAVFLATLAPVILSALAYAGDCFVLAGLGALVAIVVALGTLVPFFSVGVRRLHDRGLSAWWMLVGFIPYIGGIILIVLYSLRGDEGDNAYGPPPGSCSSCEGVAP